MRAGRGFTPLKGWARYRGNARAKEMVEQKPRDSFALLRKLRDLPVERQTAAPNTLPRGKTRGCHRGKYQWYSTESIQSSMPGGSATQMASSSCSSQASGAWVSEGSAVGEQLQGALRVIWCKPSLGEAPREGAGGHFSLPCPELPSHLGLRAPWTSQSASGRCRKPRPASPSSEVTDLARLF